MLRSCILALTLALVASTAPLKAMTEDGTLVFGVISTESSSNLEQTWTPFLDAMEKGLDRSVKAFFAPDYGGVIEAMKYGKVDAAWFGNKSAMEAVDRAGGEIFCQTVDVDGNPGYWSLLVVHKDSPYNSVDEIIADGDQLVFGNGDPNSTSGFLVPSYYVWGLRGIDPNQHFQRVTNANHEANLLSVANKRLDFATNNTESLRRLQQTNPDAAAKIKVIWKSPLIPSDPFVWRKNLDDETKNLLKGWILSYGRVGTEQEQEQAQQILATTSSGFAPFRNSSNHQLLPIRQLALFKERIKIQNDDKYSAAEKEQKISDIDEQLADLKLFTELVEQGY